MWKRFSAGVTLSLLPLLLSGQTPKKKITVAADVPQFQYPIQGKVEDLVLSAEAFKPFAAEVRRNVESVLRDYEIDDATTKRGLIATLLALDILEGRDADARKRLDEVKALEEKPSAKLLSGITSRAILDAGAQIKDHNSPQYRQLIYASIKRSLDSLPFDVVQNDVKSLKANAEIVSESLIVGQIRASLDPVVAKTGGLSSDLAHALPGMRVMLVDRIPLRETFAEVLGAYLSAHAVEKKDIWEARNVTLEPGKNYAPVNVAVWDSGVDLPVFKDQVAKDSSGKPPVIAYDLDSRKTTGYLYPLTPAQQARFKSATGELKGLSDMQANIESPEATQLKKKLSGMKPDEVKPFVEEISLTGSILMALT